MYRASQALLDFFLDWLNFWSEHARLLSRMANILSNGMGKIILGWATSPRYVTLSNHDNFTQTDIVYPAWVRLPKIDKVTQAGKITHPG